MLRDQSCILARSTGRDDMTHHNLKTYLALVIACMALALSIHTALRGPSETKAGAGATVDREAREQIAQLRRVLAERDATIARLSRAAIAPAAGPAAAGPSQRPSPPVAEGPRLYARFEIANPAVTVTQKDDGTYDIRTTDPRLSGSSMTITAVTQTGEEDTLYIRIP